MTERGAVVRPWTLRYRRVLTVLTVLAAAGLALVARPAYAMHIAEGFLPPMWAAVWFAASAPFVVLGLFWTWRVSPICWRAYARAYAALELPAGTALASDTRAGHLLRIDRADVRETAISASAARSADGQ